MAKDVATSAYPSGAGRTFDALLQLTEGTSVSTAARSATFIGRSSGLALGSLASNVGAAGTKVVSGNRLANNYVPGTGDGTIFAIGPDHLIERPPFNTISEEAGAVRFVFTFKVTGLPAAFPPASGVASDFGMCFYATTNLAGMSNLMSSAPTGTQNAGFGFACNAAGNPVLAIKQTQQSGSAPQVTVLDAVNLLTSYMTFDVRFIGATSTSDATMTTVLNGTTVSTLSWGAGTTLPTIASMAGATYSGAFRPIFGCASGSGVTSLQLAYFRCIKGPNFTSLF